MPIIFYPYEDDLKKSINSTIAEKIEILLEAAERFKAYMLDPANAASSKVSAHHAAPSEIKIAYNWDGLASVLRDVREMPEGNATDKRLKADHLLKLAEVYEVLRAAKMQKLEAVRLALVTEANQLRGGSPVA
jgi:hypothetical protein